MLSLLRTKESSLVLSSWLVTEMPESRQAVMSMEVGGGARQKQRSWEADVTRSCVERAMFRGQYE